MRIDVDVMEYLKEYHAKEADALKSRDLGVLFNLTNREVRNLVSKLRQDGVPICSSNNGYWYSEDAEDITRTIKRLADQVQNMRLVIKGLSKAKEAITNAEKEE